MGEAVNAFDAELLGMTDAQVLEKKTQVDMNLSIERVKLDDAKVEQAAFGRYLPVAEYRRLRHRVAALQRLSQMLQAELAKRKAERSAFNKANVEAGRAHAGTMTKAEIEARKDARVAASQTFDRRFVQAAKTLLPRETFEQLLLAAGQSPTPRLPVPQRGGKQGGSDE